MSVKKLSKFQSGFIKKGQKFLMPCMMTATLISVPFFTTANAFDSGQGIHISGKENTNKCFHKKNAGWVNGNPIHIWDCSAGSSENKTWVYDSNTGYIKGKDNPNKCLHKKEKGWANGNPIHIWDCSAGSSENKTWVYDSNTGYIKGKDNPNKCLHKKEKGWANGNPIHIWDCSAGSNENKSWNFEAAK